ncbi:MAG: hypothetical protein ACYC7H_00910 [Chloroflexota bacterium]
MKPSKIDWRTEPTGLARFRWAAFTSCAARNGLLQPRGDRLRTYSPADHPRLATDLARLAQGEEEEVVRFVTNWGVLGYSRLPDRSEAGGQVFSLPGPDDYDPLAWILAHAMGADTCLRTWRVLQAPDTGALAAYLMSIASSPVTEKAIEAPPPGLVLRFTHGVLRDQVVTELPVVGSWEDVGREVIQRIVNPNLAGFRLAVSPAANPQTGFPLELRYAASTLLEVAYWHLARIVAGYSAAEDVRECAECHSLFLRTYPTQRFCPSDPFTDGHKQGRCGKRARMRELRKKEVRLRGMAAWAIRSTQGVVKDLGTNENDR